MSQQDAQAPPDPLPPQPRESPSVLLGRLWVDRWLRLGVVAALILLVVAPFAVSWIDYRCTHSITDDAFVQTHVVNIAPQEVSGHLVRYQVQEHDLVAAGQLLAEIDPVPYREQVALLQAKLGVAEAQLAAAQTSLEVLRAQVPREIEVAQKALAAAKAEQARDERTLQFTTEDVEKGIHEARSDLEAARARLVLAETDHQRYATLFAKEAATQRESQVATRTYRTTQAEVKASEARLGRALAGQKKEEAVRQAAVAAGHQTQKSEQALGLAQTRRLDLELAQRQVEVKSQQVGEARRALDVAKTSLRYTRIVAPFPGVVVHLYRHLGDHVPAGTPILSLYNPELTYVTANLEESKLEGVAPGNPVLLDIDAFSKLFHGRVVWINKATGANFALIPRNISSGEFTKVVQRVPVRILVEKDERWPQLRAGLSVTVAIEHGPGDPEWAKQAADEMRALGLPRHARFGYCTYLALVFGGQVTVEPLGDLLAFNPSWRMLFAALGACGVCLVSSGLFIFPDDRPGHRPQHGFDFAGAGLFMAIFGLVLFLLYRGNYLGWRVSTPIVTAALAVLTAVALFIWRELVAAEPFLNVGGFAFRTVALAMLASGFWCAAMYGVAIQLPNCLLVLGFEHFKTGWVILPMGLTVVAVMVLGGFVRDRGRLVWMFRLGLAGMTAMGFWLARIDVYTPWQWVMGVSSLWAVFAGLCMSPVSQLTFEGQPPEAAGATGGMKFFMRSFNGTVGILLAGVLIDQGTWWGLEFVRDGIVQGQGAVQVDVPAIRDHLVRHGSAPSAATTQGEAVLGSWVNLHAQVIGYRTGLRCCAYLSAVGLVVSCFIHRRKEVSVFDSG